jgi:PAT family beta-lactamase induction signal transducer AmpG
MHKFLSIFAEPRIMATLLLGFASGLPLALSGGTLQAWFTDCHLSLKDIGYAGLAGLPYTFKFIWAPVMDRWVPPFLGRRRGWILIFQFLLCVLIGSMVFFTPDVQPKILFFIACLIAFTSASQDIVIDAYRTDLLHPEERALGAAMATNGYRVAMLTSGGFALIIADHYGWKACFLVMMFLMAMGIVTTFLSPEPESVVIPPKKLRDCIVLPFVDFLKRPQAIWILLFIVCYKLGDAFAGAMSQVFLLRAVHLSLTAVGSMAKILGFLGTLFGTTAGGLLVIKMGWFRALLVFGILQAVSNLAYMPLMWLGPDYLIAGMAVFIENLCGGMGAAVFVGLIMSLCNARFSAFQYALLSSLSAVGRVVVGPLAGVIASDYGWISYFMASLVLSVPGLLLLFLLKRRIEVMTKTVKEEREAGVVLAPASG